MKIDFAELQGLLPRWKWLLAFWSAGFVAVIATLYSAGCSVDALFGLIQLGVIQLAGFNAVLLFIFRKRDPLPLQK